ncbi:MAG: endonuclease domain-containing protein [Patescibacteria group bacterium]
MAKKMTKIARSLRKRQTQTEAIMWSLLRNRRFMNIKFRRQCPIGPYIADFCAMEHKLVLEVDGGGHNFPKQIERDRQRDFYLKRRGYSVIRVWANEVYENIDGVLEEIYRFVNNTSPSVPFLKERNA